MTSSIEAAIKESEPTTVAFVSMTGPFTQIGDAFGRLYAWIGQRGLTPSGPPVGVYYNSPGQVPDDQLSWELRSPIAGELPPEGPNEQGLGIKKLAAVQVAATIHRGPYDNVGDTYGALMGWVAEHGYEVAGPPEEVYLSNPDETPPAELVTEIRFPVTKR